MWLVLKTRGFVSNSQSPITSYSFNQTFPLQYPPSNFAKHRKWYIPKGLKIMQLVKQLTITVSILVNNFFFSCDGSRDLICIMSDNQIDKK